MKEVFWEYPPYRNKLGDIIEADEMEILLRDKEYRVIGQDRIDNYLISTVWLGVPHDMGEAYFETVITKIPKDSIDTTEGKGFDVEIDIHRYSTLNEAEEGHAEIVKIFRGDIK